MKIRVGSKNKVKVGAVEEIIKDYPHLAHASVEAIEVDTGISPQPRSIDETIRGAINRARGAFKGADYGIGLESGWMDVPHTKSGHMDVCACAIYDGKEFHIGLSSAWEFPDKRITSFIFKDGLNTTEAMLKAGLAHNHDLGSEEGAIGVLTKGRMNRKEYTKQALRTALIHLEESYE